MIDDAAVRAPYLTRPGAQSYTKTYTPLLGTGRYRPIGEFSSLQSKR